LAGPQADGRARLVPLPPVATRLRAGPQAGAPGVCAR
jgi:hypothetical protein